MGMGLGMRLAAHHYYCARYIDPLPPVGLPCGHVLVRRIVPPLGERTPYTGLRRDQ